MSEPENKLDPAVAVTPAPAATQPVVENQPAVVATPDETAKLKEELEQEKARAKRYKEQLAGKDKLIDELKIKKIVEEFKPTPEPEPSFEEPAPEIRKPEIKQQPQMSEAQAKQTIYINQLMLKDKFSNDPTLPYNEEVKQKIEAVLEEMDPSGKVKLSPDAWNYGYNIVKGRMADEIANVRVEQVRREYQEKEKVKVASHVETPTTTPTPTGPTIDDVLSGKVKMGAKEMLTKFPELRKQVAPSTLKEYGLKIE